MISVGIAKNRIRYSSGGALISQRMTGAAEKMEEVRRLALAVLNVLNLPSPLCCIRDRVSSRVGNKMTGIDAPCDIDRIAHFKEARSAYRGIGQQDRKSVV